MQKFELLEPGKMQNVHFIGIGGSSMSGLAEILISRGYKVSGSDMKDSTILDKLRKMGAEIYISHSESNIKNPDLVVYTAAIKDNNPELVKAKSLGITNVDRASLLGALMKKYPYNIAVSGTHGKTTTTSMVSMIMLEAGKDPTIHIGGELQAINGSTKIGNGNYFITEACEYCGSFLKFHPYLGIITNIEVDHVDYFKDIEHIKQTFLKFGRLLPKDGYVVYCADDMNTVWVANHLECNKISYGIKNTESDWTAADIVFDTNGCASYSLIYRGTIKGSVSLGVPGIHNVYNSLAAIASCSTLGCSIDDCINGLSKFTGTRKRFELKGIADGIKVIDDYAHHPSEVKATLKAAKNCGHSKIWCIFQPHTYTRTKQFIDDFSHSFNNADAVIITDIYSARETDTGEINSKMLADRMSKYHDNVKYMSSFEEIASYLSSNVKPGEMIITMGAGDICKVGDIFLERKKQVAV